MVKVKANGAMSAILSPLKERVEVLDDEGRFLGFFVPAEVDVAILRRKAFADYESGEYQERRAESEGDERSTTEQVLERLRKLGTP